jgi:hypothetical protein
MDCAYGDEEMCGVCGGSGYCDECEGSGECVGCEQVAWEAWEQALDASFQPLDDEDCH